MGRSPHSGRLSAAAEQQCLATLAALRDDVRADVAERLGPGGVLIIDDTGFIKKGTTSAGGSVGGTHRHLRKNRQLSDRRVRRLRHQLRPGLGGPGQLCLPKAWTSDRDRCRAAKIPDGRGFATKGEPRPDIVRRRLAAGLPASWVTADGAYGQELASSAACSSRRASATWWRCPSPSRSSPWPASGASTISSMKYPT
ncbi:transposase [Streptomyces sp. TG1A-8]|uniref:transposase n=1 Tax=Streptomyces sp. TG1A-8 TaxID=3051385 RepID=UPI0034638F32